VTQAAPSPAEARHEIANLLHTYTEVADRKDVPAGVELLGGATVRFPTGGFEGPAGAEAFLARLWGSPVPHRHDVTNLVVHAAGPGAFRATAHYTRWLLDPEPLLHTLGEYDVQVDARTWRITSLVVSRTWTRA
jgi:hypothetical protein